MFEQFRYRVLGRWSDFVCRRPGWVLFIAGVVSVASICVTWQNLTFQSDRNALLSMDLDWNRNFEDWRTSFPGNDDLYVVVDAGPVQGPGLVPHAQRLKQAQALVDQLGPALMADEHVEFAIWGFDAQRFSPRTLRMLPLEEFNARLAQIAQSQVLLSSPTPQHLLAAAMGVMRQQSPPNQDDGAHETQIAQGVEELARLIGAIGEALRVPIGQRPDLGQLMEAAQGEQENRIYLASENGRMLFIRVTPRKEAQSINALADAIEAIRGMVDKVSPRYPGVEAGLTGIDVVEADETDTAMRDSTITSLIAAVLITVMLTGAFGGWRVPVLAVAALGVGIVWTFGFLTLAVGHLQVLSIVFAVILLGLGIAYGVHLASCVELIRHKHADTPQGFSAAMRESFQTVGPGVITGAVTTSAAFCTTMLTDFRGVAEMGLIAAGGIFLCLFSMFSVFPALLSLYASGKHHFDPARAGRFRVFEPRWVMPFVKRPRATLATAAVVTGVSLIAVAQMDFDYDLMKLQPRGVDSVQWQDRIAHDGGQSIWAAVSVADSLEEARRLKDRYMALACVADVKGIGMLFPSDEAEKIEKLTAMRNRLGTTLTAALADEPSAQAQGPVPDLGTQLMAMRLALGAAMNQEMPQVIHQRLQGLAKVIGRVTTSLSQLNGDQRTARLGQLQDEYQQWRQQTAAQIDAALDTSPLVPTDLPGELVRPYIGNAGPHAGKYALEIHPRLPAGVDGPLAPVFLPQFIGQLEQLDEHITGVIVQVYRSGHLILRSYQAAGLYALAVVFVLVWLDFRSARAASLSLLPVAVGFVVTAGVMWLAGVSVNPANIIVLPLMFGIGVDSGVHMLHRCRQDPHGQPVGLTCGTGKGITVTSLTAVIGFGSMMFASHRGIASLGFVMATGIGLTMLACWTVMPAWLCLVSARRATRNV